MSKNIKTVTIEIECLGFEEIVDFRVYFGLDIPDYGQFGSKADNFFSCNDDFGGWVGAY